MLVDVLCYIRGKIVNEEIENPERASGITGTAEHLVEETFESIKSEHERQNGDLDEEWYDFCCFFIEFAGRFYGVDFGYTHVDGADYSADPWDVSRFEGKVEIALTYDGDELYYEGSDPFDFYVKPSAKFFFIEVEWDDGPFALNMHIRSPYTTGDGWTYRVEGGAVNQPEKPLTLAVNREDLDGWSGDWEVTMAASDIAHDVDYEVAVTVFNWERSLPTGYSALQ